VKTLRFSLAIFIPSIAFVLGLSLMGREMGPAASVREQYRIFNTERSKIRKSMETAPLEDSRAPTYTPKTKVVGL